MGKKKRMDTDAQVVLNRLRGIPTFTIGRASNIKHGVTIILESVDKYNHLGDAEKLLLFLISSISYKTFKELEILLRKYAQDKRMADEIAKKYNFTFGV